MQWLTDLTTSVLDSLYGLTSSYVGAIVLLTILVRLILLPFSIAQVRATQKMQELQPKILELQKKYKNNPEKLNKETMELWRKHKVNPLAGCLTVLLQFPVLIALFGALQNYNYTGDAGFLWVKHLAEPDPIGLPLLAAVTTYWQMKVTMTPSASGDQTQRMMMVVMPILIGWMATRFAAGLAVYWVVSNLFGIVQQYFTPKRPASVKEGSKA